MLPRSRMRVAYVVKRYPRYSETFIVNEILAHEAAGCEIDIYALRPPVDTHFQDIISRVRAPVEYLSRPSRATHVWDAFRAYGARLPAFWDVLSTSTTAEIDEVCQAAQLALFVQARGSEHIHAHFATSATTVAMLASRMIDVPFSFTTHAKDIFHESTNPMDLRRKLREASNVVAISDFNQRYLESTFGEAASRVRRIYNGLDLDRFPYSPPALREPLVLGVGRLVEKKGFRSLISACHLLDRCGVPFSCQIAGVGPLAEDLERQIRALDLHHRVELIGARPQGELIELMQRAAVFVAPCIEGEDGNRDGLPTVLLEAMALGTPCIATPVTGIPEVLRHEETGLMIPQHDPAAMATAIRRLIGDGALRKDLAASARQLIEDRFDIHENAATLRAMFESTNSYSVAAG